MLNVSHQRAHPACLIQGNRERLAGVLERRDVGEQGAGIEVHGVPTDRSEHRHPGLDQRVAEIACRADPVGQVVVADGLLQPLGQRLEVAATIENACGFRNQENYERRIMLPAQPAGPRELPAVEVNPTQVPRAN